MLFLFEAWEKMLQFTSFKRQEINFVFKIKNFVVSKIWYFNKSIYFYFPKFWVVTANTQGSMIKDLIMITCYKCKQKGHYADKCTKKSTGEP
jgi:hypothetical protein